MAGKLWSVQRRRNTVPIWAYEVYNPSCGYFLSIGKVDLPAGYYVYCTGITRGSMYGIEGDLYSPPNYYDLVMGYELSSIVPR